MRSRSPDDRRIVSSRSSMTSVGEDRVLAAEATRTVNVGWISRGALDCPRAARPRGRVVGIAPPTWRPAYGGRGPSCQASWAPAVGTSAGRAWRAHSLRSARTAATYLRACAENDGGLGQTRQELLDLLADSLVQASRLDAHLTGEDPGGSCALWN